MCHTSSIEPPESDISMIFMVLTYRPYLALPKGHGGAVLRPGDRRRDVSGGRNGPEQV